MNARLQSKLLHGFTSPAMLRAYIDATTATVPARRKSKQRRSASLPFALLLILIAAAAFIR